LRLEQKKAEFGFGGKETIDVQNIGNKTSTLTQGKHFRWLLQRASC
jgi:hypothetical protein